MPEEEIGIVKHWFGKIQIVGIEITNGSIKVGDKLHFKGHTSDFEEKITSLQVEHKEVPEAKKRELVGIKVSQAAREHDKVFKVS